MTVMSELVLHKKTFQELTTDELYELLRVRSEVFVVEQNCVYQDMDGDDRQSIHLWLTVQGRVVALARVCPASCFTPLTLPLNISMQSALTLRLRNMPEVSMKALDSANHPTPSCSMASPI